MADATISQNSDITAITRCYLLLALGMPLTFLPLAQWAFVGMICLAIGVVWAYMLKKRDNPSELVANHARWMIRTFWISSLYAAIAIVLAGITVSGNADNTALAQLNQLTADGSTPSEEQVRALAMQFQSDNAPLLMWATIGYLSIPILFAVLRYGRGYKLARGGNQVSNITSWSF